MLSELIVFTPLIVLTASSILSVYIDIHDLRACSGQTCRNVDKGEFYLGEEVNADGRIADDAQNNQGENEHGGKNGSLDRGIRIHMVMSLSFL